MKHAGAIMSSCALMAAALLTGGASGCGQLAQGDASVADAEADAPMLRCGSGSTFGGPTPLGPSINMSSDDSDIHLTPDELVAYFWTTRKATDGDIFIASRTSIAEAFGAAAEVPWTTDPGHNPFFPNITPDQLAIVGTSTALSLPALSGATRTSTSQPFGTLSTIRVGVATSTMHFGNAPYLLDDGLKLYFDGTVLPGDGIAMATRATRNDDFGAIIPVPVDVGDAGDWTGGPVVTPDELTLFFIRGLVPGIWTASRSSTDAPFTDVRELTEIDSSFPSLANASPYPNWISPDGCRLYFTVSIATDDAGGSQTDIYVASRSP